MRIRAITKKRFLIIAATVLGLGIMVSSSCTRSTKTGHTESSAGESAESETTGRTSQGDNHEQADDKVKIDLSQHLEGQSNENGETGICSPELVLCGETEDDCVDVNTSIQHCGECGRRCFSNQKCTEGSCSGVGVITAAQLKEAMENKDFLLINVRVPPVGIIPGTDASIPHNQLDRMVAAIGEDRDKRVVLYCGTSTRIKIALQLLRERGYKNISVLENGVSGWRQAGFPTQSG